MKVEFQEPSTNTKTAQSAASGLTGLSNRSMIRLMEAWGWEQLNTKKGETEMRRDGITVKVAAPNIHINNKWPAISRIVGLTGVTATEFMSRLAEANPRPETTLTVLPTVEPPEPVKRRKPTRTRVDTKGPVMAVLTAAKGALTIPQIVEAASKAYQRDILPGSVSAALKASPDFAQVAPRRWMLTKYVNNPPADDEPILTPPPRDEETMLAVIDLLFPDGLKVADLPLIDEWRNVTRRMIAATKEETK